MHANRQSRLRLKAKERNSRAMFPTLDDKKQLPTFCLSEKPVEPQNDDEVEGAPFIKKVRSCEYEDVVNIFDSVRSGQQEKDDVVMISDDDNDHDVEMGVRHQSKAKIMSPKTEDLSLMKLREQLLQIQSTVCSTKHLEDLPAFTNTPDVNNTRETTADILISTVNQQLSPLPKMCSWCLRRKHVNLDSSSVIETFKDVQCNNKNINKTKSSGHTLSDNTKSGLVLQIDNPDVLVSHTNISSKGNHHPKNSSSSILMESKELNSTIDMKPAGSKTILLGGEFQTKDSMTNSSQILVKGKERIRVENRKAGATEERGDNLFLRLSKNFSVSSGVKENWSEIDQVGITKGRNPLRLSISDEQTVMQKSKKQINEETDNKLKGDNLKSCPLCQMNFEIGISQVDLDGHIAVCLASAEDDVIW